MVVNGEVFKTTLLSIVADECTISQRLMCSIMKGAIKLCKSQGSVSTGE